MTNPFANILILDSVEDLLMLSLQGDLLYNKREELPESIEKRKLFWKGLISILGRPDSAEFFFDSGLYYLHYTQVGYLIFALNSSSQLEKLKEECGHLRKSFADSQQLKQFFLKMLENSSDYCIPHIVEKLLPYADKEVAVHLLAQLKKYPSFLPGARGSIILAICQTLGHCNVSGVNDALKKFQYHIAKSPVASEEIDRAIQVSLKQLELETSVEQSQISKDLKDDGVFVGTLVDDVIGEEEEEQIEVVASSEVSEKIVTETQVNAAKSGNINTREEKRIKRLVAEGKTHEAGLALLKIIEIAAKQKKFETAEKLREKLIEIDSMMLKEIIRAAEIIEEEKLAAIDPQHMETWKILIGMLSKDEFSALYHLMDLKKYRNGERIVNQGSLLSMLYFINTGQIQLYATVDGQEIELKTFKAGEVVGAGSFFEASAWTLNARSLGAEVLTLSRKNLNKLQIQFPSIESKLIDFCALFVSPRSLFRRTKRNRRKYERKKIEGRATLSLLDKEGVETGVTIKGELFDISRGGLSIFLNISKKKNALLLFGGKIKILVPVKKGLQSSSFSCNGKIIAIRAHHVVSNEYSVHIEFDKVLERKSMDGITTA